MEGAKAAHTPAGWEEVAALQEAGRLYLPDNGQPCTYAIQTHNDAARHISVRLLR